MINLDAYGKTPRELLLLIAENEKKRRKQLGMTQNKLAEEASISLASLRRFEQKGEIALSSLMKIAIVLRAQDEFLSLFPSIRYKSIKEIINAERKESRHTSE